jgi:probable rRNA maturation factor
MSDEPPPVLTVDGHDETELGWPDLDRWAALARDTLLGEGVVIGHLDLFFVDRESMRELNRHHLGPDRPTDVLAFPLDGPTLASTAASPARDEIVLPTAPGGPSPHLGDVVVCPDMARDQAPDHTGSLDAELALLVIHGVLHVLGHDHAEPAETLAMQSRERHHLAQAGFAHPVAL